MQQPPKSTITRIGSGDNNEPRRVLAYLRVSTQDQVDNGTSLESQRDKILEWAKYKKYPEPKFYMDEGISGATNDRPSLLRLLSDIKPGNLVVTASLDRMARKTLIFLEILEKIENAGAEFMSLREDINTTTAMGKGMASLLAVFATMDRDAIIERMSLGRAKRHAEGKWAAGKPPYGYRRLDTGFLEQVGDEVRIVRMIFDCRSRGLSLSRIVHELRSANLRTRQGAKWRTGTVSGILDQPGYSEGKHNSTGSTMPPIIDMATYKASERVREKNKSMRPAKANGKPWPLQGARCVECGRTWGVNSNTKTRRTYFCHGRENDESREEGETRCSVPRQPAHILEQTLLDELERTLSDPACYKAAIDAAIARLRADEERLSRDRRPFEQEMVSQKTRIDRLTDAYARQRLSPESYESEITDAEKRVRELQAQLDALGPETLHELEHTRELLAGAKNLSMIAGEKAAMGIPMRRLSWSPELWPTDEAVKFEKTGGPLGHISDAGEPSDALREIMSQTSGEAYFYADHVEIRGHLPVTVQLQTNDHRLTSSSPRGLG